MHKWIGEEVNTTGAYIKTTCSEVIERHRKSGDTDTPRLYRFTSRFDEIYYISDEEIVTKLAELLEKDDSAETYEYLYNLIAQRFGMANLLVNIGHKIARERDAGYKLGKKILQQKMRDILGMP